LKTKEPTQPKDLSSRKLSLEEGTQLVHLARQAITKYLEKHEFIKHPEGLAEELLRRSGAFVTLNSTEPVHELRGCIGFPYPEQPQCA
jgi:AMMECR1 domain-containing protein